MKTLSLAVCLSLAALSIPVTEKGHTAASLAPRALAEDVPQQVEARTLAAFTRVIR